MSKSLKCFVINPMGMPNDADRVRTERIWQHILRPAIALAESRTGFKIGAVPEHENQTSREIVSRFVKRIIDDDLLIALIHGKNENDINPNVMYEIGIAHSAGRDDMIILRDDAQLRIKKIFDIETRYQLAYAEQDLLPQAQEAPSAVVRTLADALEANIRSIDAGRSRRVAFGNTAFDALGSRHSEYHVIRKFNGSDPFENLPFEKWAKFFHETDTKIDIMGVSLLQLLNSSKSWIMRDGTKVPFSTFLKFKALYDGVDIRLVFMHEDNPALREMLRGVVSGEDPEQLDVVRSEIRRSTTQWRAHAKEVADAQQPPDAPRKGSIRLIKLRRGIVNERLSLTDRAIIVTPIFLHVELNGIGPALWASNTTSVYEFFREHVEYLIAHAADTEPLGEVATPRPAAGST